MLFLSVLELDSGSSRNTLLLRLSWTQLSRELAILPTFFEVDRCFSWFFFLGGEARFQFYFPFGGGYCPLLGLLPSATGLKLSEKGVVVPPRKLFPNWTKVSLRTTHDWQIKFKRANEKHSSTQVLHFPLRKLPLEFNLPLRKGSQ